MMSRDPSPVLEQALSQVQACLETVSAALTAGDAPEAQRQAQSLRDAVLVLGHAAAAPARVVDPAARRRVQQMSAALAAQRLAVARHLVAVDRTLDIILPPTPATTYGRAVSSRVQRVGAHTSLRA